MASTWWSATTVGAAESSSVAFEAAFADQIDAGILFVAAAGNDGENNDAVPTYPDATTCPASSPWPPPTLGHQSRLSPTTASISVDLFAPGGAGSGDSDDILQHGARRSRMRPGISTCRHVDGLAARGRCGRLDSRLGSRTVRDGDEGPDSEHRRCDPAVRSRTSLTGGRLNVYECHWRRSSRRTSQVTSSRTATATACKVAGEPGITNWTVYVDMNRNDRLDAGEPSDRHRCDGQLRHRACSTAPGTYRVNQVLKPQWTRPIRPFDGHTWLRSRGVA